MVELLKPYLLSMKVINHMPLFSHTPINIPAISILMRATGEAAKCFLNFFENIYSAFYLLFIVDATEDALNCLKG